MSRIDAIAARQRLVDDRYYYLRGCGPDEEYPWMSAGDPDVPVNAWGPYTDDGAEPQRVRLARERAALAICGRCPVLALCRVYANTTTVDETGVEHLVEPEGILGGELALTRHRALIAHRHAATVGDTTATAPAAPPVRNIDDARTPQKLAVLDALAVELYDERVARRASMDVRTCNWHRSALCSLFGLDRETATRDELLLEALRHGLIPTSTRVVWDGLWPVAAAPTTDGARQRRIAPGIPAALLVPQPRARRRPRRASILTRLLHPRALFPAAALAAPTPVLEPAA
ncbi:hypothetical protein ACFVS9_28045 [Streptomyces sp. NPDC058008]|uniref:hypothetical protein n=1 Tax=Streptomyces sp. NPDC058008 TaxID=3346303 RepID=UPI0036ECAE3A